MPKIKSIAVSKKNRKMLPLGAYVESQSGPELASKFLKNQENTENCMIFDDPFFVSTSRGVSWRLVASREVRATWSRPWVRQEGFAPLVRGSPRRILPPLPVGVFANVELCVCLSFFGVLLFAV